MTRLKWTGALVGLWLSILAAHKLGVTSLLFNGLAYAGLTSVAVAAISRSAASDGKTWHPAFSRMVALLICATFAGVDTGLAGLTGEAAQKFFFAALLGIALVILAARHAPAAWRQRWLGKGG